MTDQLSEAAPIACALGASDFKARLAWIADLNNAALRDHRRDDLRLELTYAAEAREQVLQMIRGEQECCAFLTFDVRDEPGVVRVIIQAPEAARDAAEAVFEPFQSKTPTQGGYGCCAVAS
jgi:hypothetical protein